jgi:raffinose/stachyose/melibiose transport system permease protein
MRQEQAASPPAAVRLRAVTPSPQPDVPRTPGEGRRASWLPILLFLLPALALYAVLVVTPVAQALLYSGYDWNGLGPRTDFVGLDNYRQALADTVFLSALRHNGIIMALSLAFQLPFALGLALLLNRRMRGRGLLRLLFFAPFVVSEVITAVVWTLILQPDGLADRTLEGAGLGFLVRGWLADPTIVLYTVFVVISWRYFGFHMIIYLAGLQQIPRELEEAAAIDGATEMQILRYVTLPLLGPTIRVSVFLSIIGSLQVFDLVWVMTGGGPVHGSTTMAVYMLDWGFRRFQLGYGSAVAVILFAVSLAFALAYQRFVLRRDVEGAVTAVGVR